MPNRINYQLEMEKVLKQLDAAGTRPKLLLHACCAPCSTACLERLEGLMDVTVGSLRGLGYSMMPTIVSLIGACGLRILWVYTVFAMDHSLQTLYISYPVSWILTFTIHAVCYLIFARKRIQKGLA